MYKGKMCASTTRYNDQTKAACGCGNSDPVPKDWWTLTQYTAAMDCKNLDPEHPFNAWCPKGCGACYKLCSTGGSMHGHRPEEGECRVFKITNRCGDGFKEYPMWCSNNLSWPECKANPHICRQMHSTNHYGYPAHFDLQDFHHQILQGLKWDNVEVTFEPVPCDEGGWKGEDWNCFCDSLEGEKGTGSHHSSGGSTAGSGEGGESGKGGKGGTKPSDGKDGTETTDSVLGVDGGSSGGQSGDCGKEWEGCGGRHFKGAKCCQDGCYCEHLGERGNEHYSHQCVPSHWKGCKYSADNGITKKFEVSEAITLVEARPLPASRFLFAALPVLVAGMLFARAFRLRRSQNGNLLPPGVGPDEDPVQE